VLLGLVASVSAQQSDQPAPATSDAPKPAYVVNGMTLGSRMQTDTAAYRTYQCEPSEQFSGYTYCKKSGSERGTRGQVETASSLLHAPDGTIVYVNRSAEPVYSSSGDAKKEIQRLAQEFGAPPRITDIPKRADGIDAVMATWGDVVLEPLDAASISQLAAGRSLSKGYMIDFIGNFRRSAQLGLPVYRLTGGPGYVWVASYNQNGRGGMRFVAVDAAAFGTAASPPAVASQPSPADQTAAAAAPPAAAARPSAPERLPPAAKPAAADKPPSADKPQDADLSVAELNQKIDTLKAELTASTGQVAALQTAKDASDRALKDAQQARVVADNARQQAEQAGAAERQKLEAKSRMLQTLAFAATTGLVIIIAVNGYGLWTQRRRQRPLAAGVTPSRPKPPEPPRPPDAVKPEPPAEASPRLNTVSENNFGLELERHVANINATPDQPQPQDDKQPHDEKLT
jgi:hypothetical protein